MAKIIRFDAAETEKYVNEFDAQMIAAREKFIESLRGKNVTNGKISIQLGTITKTFDAPERKAELHFSEKAWIKMHALIREFDSEIAWHGVAYRDEDQTKDAYNITDILCYPQEVSAAKVDTDQVAYQNWMFDLPNEEFNNLKMQGHSHVNMGVTPSSTDEENQKDILDSIVDDSSFYIFMVWNKRDERNIKIYDIGKNVLFEPADITVFVDDETIGLDDFISSAKEMVKKKTYSYQNNSWPKPAVVTNTPAKPAEKKEEKEVKKISDITGTSKNTTTKSVYPKNSYGYDEWDDWDSYYGYGKYPKRAYTDPFAYSDEYGRIYD